MTTTSMRLRVRAITPPVPTDPDAGYGSKSDMIVAVQSTFMAITFLIVGLRMFTRMRIVKHVGSDDILILFGALCTEGLDVSGLLAARYYALGRHVNSFPPTLIVRMQQLMVIAGFMYLAAHMFIKLSLLVFYLRLSKNKLFRRFVYVMMGVTISIFTASSISEVLRCLPLKKLWMPDIEGKCVDRQTYYYANASLNILSDLIIYFLPIPMLWGSLMNKRQKHRVTFIFSIGSLVCIASCVRLYYVHAMANTDDSTFVLADALVWSTIEVNVAIVCASIPTYQAFFIKYCPRFHWAKEWSSPSDDDDIGAAVGREGKSLRLTPLRYGEQRTVVVGGDERVGGNACGDGGLEADGMSVGSEKRILPPEGGIMKSTSVRMTTEERPAPEDSVDDLGP